MTAKKRKRRPREYAITSKGLLLLMLLFLGCISILVFFYYLSHADKTVSAPIYEEINAKKSSFMVEAVKIDNAIYESLYRGGIPEENILFL